MTEHEKEVFIKENIDTLTEMVEFWTWVRGTNKAIKWMALYGLPFAVSIWAFLKWVAPIINKKQ